MLEADAAIENVHKEAEAESEAKHDRRANANLHFITFVDIGGLVVEFDGRKDCQPVVRAVASSHGDDFLAAAVAAIRQRYIEISPDALRFNIMALSRTTGEGSEKTAGQGSVNTLRQDDASIA